MSEWANAKSEAKKELKEMEKSVPGYGYAEPKQAEATDGSFRKAMADELNRSRDFLFPMIEAAYIGKDMENAGALEQVMQWLNAFLLELSLPLLWNEKADSRAFSKLIRHDAALLGSAAKLTGTLKDMCDIVLHGKSVAVAKKCAQLNASIIDMLSVYKRRRHALGE